MITTVGVIWLGYMAWTERAARSIYTFFLMLIVQDFQSLTESQTGFMNMAMFTSLRTPEQLYLSNYLIKEITFQQLQVKLETAQCDHLNMNSKF